MEFATKLKALRKKVNMTQGKLAEKADVSLRSIQNFEKGVCRPRYDKVYKKLSQIFNVPIDYLKNDEIESVDDRAVNKAQAQVEAEKCISQIKCLFAGGHLKAKDRKKVMERIKEIYEEIETEDTE